ncbi:hypothetical protein H310_12959 [Aphanomyces invadans]|uniref:Uncharacterized protein n=1 Tax=Aphanomyces invadans TaxID=157072 RepID=A0A024TG49_9STRA|nr:hypothetical protein H310_12959 [Aphanomyces invadans]ETV92964.1 hypothetical protein H310_12959 [Aphanomyces invadans]|eukprot:XP_008878485.1 hypothetical protein H310_12959 [Aphanomyces invadans]
MALLLTTFKHTLCRLTPPAVRGDTIAPFNPPIVGIDLLDFVVPWFFNLHQKNHDPYEKHILFKHVEYTPQGLSHADLVCLRRRTHVLRPKCVPRCHFIPARRGSSGG